jgi:hypothetical protein
MVSASAGIVMQAGATFPLFVEITNWADDEPLRYTAEVDVRPRITLPDLASIEVVVDDVQVDETEVEQELSSLRQRFATLETVEPAAHIGDYAQIDWRPASTTRRCPAVRPPTFRTRSAASSWSPASTTRSSASDADVPVPAGVVRQEVRTVIRRWQISRNLSAPRRRSTATCWIYLTSQEKTVRVALHPRGWRRP